MFACAHATRACCVCLAEGCRLHAGRIAEAAEAAGLEMSELGYFVCAVGRACVYEDGYERIMAALKAAPRPVTVTFGIPS